MSDKNNIKKANEILKKFLKPGMEGINNAEARPVAISDEEQAAAVASIHAGANPNLSMFRNGPSALCCACAMGANLVVTALIEKGAGLEDRVRSYDSLSPTGYTPLGLAAEKNLGAIILDLCRAGADPMALMPTFSTREDKDAPVVWTLIFGGHAEALALAAPRIDWACRVPMPGIRTKSEGDISLFTLSSILSRKAMGALVRGGLNLPTNFGAELALTGRDEEWRDLFLKEFAVEQRAAIEDFTLVAKPPEQTPPRRRSAL